MIARLSHILTLPRFWLPLAITCFLAAMAIGYHQDQMAAASVMAEKVAGSTGSVQAFEESRTLSGARKALHALSLVLLVLALGLRLAAARDQGPWREQTGPAPRPQSTPMGFQPILTQEEIAIDQPVAPSPRASRVASRIVQGVVGPVKNQP